MKCLASFAIVFAGMLTFGCGTGSGGSNGQGGDTSEGGANAGGSDSGGDEGGAAGTADGAGGTSAGKGGTGGSPPGTGGAAPKGGAAGSPQGGAGGKPAGGTGGSAPMNTGGVPAAPGCLEFKVTYRDFQSPHADFQIVSGAQNDQQVPFVAEALGSDGNPVLLDPLPAPAQLIVSSKASFAQWFADAPGVNMAVQGTLTAAKVGALYTLGGDETGWYPIDGKGFGNLDIVAPDTYVGAEDKTLDESHNQLFTAKIEAELYYQGGKNETIISESDDDSWIFINGKLAADNGGLHGAVTASVALDKSAAALGLIPGNRYPVAFFYAERLFGGAKYRVRYNTIFTRCAR